MRKKSTALPIFKCLQQLFDRWTATRPLPKTFREENKKSLRQFSSTKTKRKKRRANTFVRFLPQLYSILDSSLFTLHFSLFTFHYYSASLRDGSKEQAGAKVKHCALHGTIVYLSLSVIVVCSPHPPLRGSPSPPGKALKIDLQKGLLQMQECTFNSPFCGKQSMAR